MPQQSQPPHLAALSEARIRQLLRERRIFGTPGAALTWGIDGVGRGDVAAGIEGERVTGRVLNTYAAQRQDMYLFHSVAWPGVTEGDTDHIIVRGGRLIVVDTKRWKRKRKYSVTAKGAILRGTVRFPEGKVKILSALRSWRRIVPPGTHISGVVCIAQREVFVPYDANWHKAPFRLVTVENLPGLLDRLTSEPLTPACVEQEWRIAKVVLPRLIRPKPRPQRLNFER